MPLPCELVPVTVPAERPGSGTINFGANGVAGTRKYAVPWSNPDGSLFYIQYIQQLLGLTIAGPSGLPVVTYPDVFSPDFPFLYCQEVDVEGEDSIGTDQWGRIRYRRAIVTAKYLPYEMGESFSLSAQALSMQENTYTYVGGLTIPPPPVYKPATRSSKPGSPASGDQAWLVAYQNWLNQVTTTLANPGITDAVYQGTDDVQQLDYEAVANPDGPDEQPPFLVPEAGTFQINFWAPGSENNPPSVTAALPFNASAAQVQAALVGVAGNGNVVCTGGPLPDAPVQITFQGSLAKKAVKLMQPANVNTTVPFDLEVTTVPPQFTHVQTGASSPASGSVSQPVTKIIPMGEYSLDRKQVLAPDFWTYIAMLGSINAFYFLGFPPWTLLLSGVEGKRGVLPNGVRIWDLTFKMHFNPFGWNFLYRPSTGQWELIASTGLNKANYYSLKSALKNQPTTITLNQNTQVHSYLYTPLDFTPILLYS